MGLLDAINKMASGATQVGASAAVTAAGNMGAGTNNDVTGDHGFGKMSAATINSMSGPEFANGLKHASRKELLGVAFGADVAKDKAIAALDAYASKIPASKSQPDDGDFGDDTPEEKMKKLIAKLKDKLVHGGSLDAHDMKELHQANHDVVASQLTQKTTTG